MKKIIFIILISLLLPISVKANDISSSLICNKTSIKIGETVECDLSMSTTEEISSVYKNINFDSKYLSIVSVKGLNNWNSKNNTMIDIYTNNSDVLLSQKIARITFKAKGSPLNGKVNISVGDDTFYNVEESTIKILSDNNKLAKLYVKGYSFSFKEDVNTYDLTVSASKVSVSATLKDTRATFEKDFGPREITLSNGVNTINIKVKSESGLINTYTINITKTDNKNSDCTLKKLSVEGHKLDKAFNKDTLDYSITVANDTKKIKVLAELNNDKAKFDNTNKPGEYELINDTTKIKIKVIAENNNTKTYTITVNKQKNNSYKLKELTLSNGVIEFKPNVYEYDFNVANEIENIEITAIPESNDAKVEIENIEKLEVGKNIIKIKVISVDKKEKIYILNVNRLTKEEILSSNTNLKSLSVKGYKLDFKTDIHDYKLTISTDSSLDIIAISEDPNSTITIIGNKSLKDGSVIKIFVTSEDTSQSVYTINIEKNKTIIYVILIISACLIILGIILLIISKKKKQENVNVDLSLEVDDKKRLILK